MKKYNQSKKAKDEFYSPILDNLMAGTMLKEDIMHAMNCSNRVARQEITDISMHYPVIAYCSKPGYRVANVKKVPIENIDTEIDEIDRTLHDLYSKVKTIKRKMKPLIAAKKMLEKRQLDDKKNNPSGEGLK